MNTETTTTTANVATETKSSKGPGRPEFTLKYPRGAFTVKELHQFNRENHPEICELTVRSHIEKRLVEGFLTKIDPVKTGKPGQPSRRYIRTAMKAAAEARSAARSAARSSEKTDGDNAATTEIPVVDVSLTETPVAETVPAEEVPV
jgi:hypothetical protein